MVFDLDAMLRNIFSSFDVTPGVVTGTVMGALLLMMILGNSFMGELFTLPLLLTLVFSAAAAYATHFLLSYTSVTWAFEDYFPAKAVYPALTAVVILTLAIIPFKIMDIAEARRERDHDWAGKV